jgi:hypothetical protein
MPLRTACPKCRKALQVPDRAIGKPVKCPACQNIWQLSKPSERVLQKQIAAAPTTQSPAPLFNSSNQFDEMMSDSLKVTTKKPLDDFVPKAAPVGPELQGLWQKGSRLVMSLRGSQFPAICVKTGKSSSIKTAHLKLYWYPNHFILTLMLGWIGHLISKSQGKKLALDVPVDFRWYKLYCIKRLLGRLTVAFGCLWVIVGIIAKFKTISTLSQVSKEQSEAMVIYGLIGILIAIVGGVFLAVACPSILTLRKMNNRYAWLSGANWRFLEQLPEWERES